MMSYKIPAAITLLKSLGATDDHGCEYRLCLQLGCETEKGAAGARSHSSWKH